MGDFSLGRHPRSATLPARRSEANEFRRSREGITRRRRSRNSMRRSARRGCVISTGGSKQFAGLTLAEVTADRISRARDVLATEGYARGKAQKDDDTGEIAAPRQYIRSGSTVNRFIATLSHAFSFAVKERRLSREIRSAISPERRNRAGAHGSSARCLLKVGLVRVTHPCAACNHDWCSSADMRNR